MILHKDPSNREVRRLVWMWTIAVGCAGVLLFWRHRPLGARLAWTAGAIVGALGTVAPPFAQSFFRAWMALVAAMNALVAQILLVLIFWGVLTPMALVLKLTGRDPLGLRKPDSQQDTYWQKHEPMTDRSSYQHLY